MKSLFLVFLFLAMNILSTNVQAQTAPTAAEAQEFMNRAESLFLVFLFLAMNILSTNVQAPTAPTAAEAQEFMNRAEAQLADLSVKVNRASWVQENFITDDTQAIAADAIDQVTAVTTDLVEQAKRFDGLTLAARSGAQVHAAKTLARPRPRRKMPRCAVR